MYYQEKLNKKREIYRLVVLSLMKEVEREMVNYAEAVKCKGNDGVSCFKNLFEVLKAKIDILTELESEIKYLQEKADEELPFEVEK